MVTLLALPSSSCAESLILQMVPPSERGLAYQRPKYYLNGIPASAREPHKQERENCNRVIPAMP